MKYVTKGPRSAVLFSRIKPGNLAFLRKYTKKKDAASVSEMVDNIISKYRQMTKKK